MAIAVSPLAAHPPRGEVLGSRKVAMPLHLPFPGHGTDVESDEPCSPDELLAMAHGLVAGAESWSREPRPSQRCWSLLARSRTVEAWVIAWPPGGAIELHDHGDSAGAVLVVAGALLETSIVPQASGGVVQGASEVGAGGSLRFARRHIHDIVNIGTAAAISIHVYSPRLTSMTYYRVTEAGLATGETVRYRLGEAVP